MRVDERVDLALVSVADALEFQAHPHFRVAPAHLGLGLDIPLRTGQAERSRAFASQASGLEVRIAMPPRLRLSVRAAAIVLPKRYAIGMPSTTRGLQRRLKLSGKR